MAAGGFFGGIDAGAGAGATGDMPLAVDKEMGTIQELSFSPDNTLLAAASWDGTLRVWRLSYERASVWTKPAFSSGAHVRSVDARLPVLGTAFIDTGLVAFGGCDKAVHTLDVETGALSFIGEHAGPVKSVKYCEVRRTMISASWDRTVKVWDTRAAKAVATEVLNERVYALDARGGLVVAGTADNMLHIWRSGLGGALDKVRLAATPLKMQTRTMSCFADGEGFCVASIEGRCSVRWADAAKDATAGFTFKCHRVGENVYPVHGVEMNPSVEYKSSFLTVGGDGQLTFWDWAKRHRLRAHQKKDNIPITAARYSNDGAHVVYAHGPDFATGSLAAQKVSVHIHALEVGEAVMA